jgi:hypothetical protein
MLTVTKKISFKNLVSEISYFKTVDELNQLLKSNTKPFKNATLLHECTGGNGTCYEFHTDNFKFKYLMEETDEENKGFSYSEGPDFNYFCKNNLEFTKAIFHYLSHPSFVFDNLFLLTNDEDDYKHVFDEVYHHLKKNHPPTIFITFRDDPVTFDAVKMLPANLIPKLYIDPIGHNDVWVLWNTDIYVSEEETDEDMERYKSNEKAFNRLSKNMGFIDRIYDLNCLQPVGYRERIRKLNEKLNTINIHYNIN